MSSEFDHFPSYADQSRNDLTDLKKFQYHIPQKNFNITFRDNSLNR